jgi:beta-1,4-mannosyl-glycoprotein beta-1,4-N-acetylglucosaminyltransferase
MIYDCFTFFNELDLLEIRLHELDAHVDQFVLVEATLTHQGKPKPLHYEENKARFAAFHHKIIHVIVSEYPDNREASAWVYEKHQRNSIRDGLKNAKAGDVIMISDVDEIPRPEKIKEAAGMKGTRIFRQRMYYYYLNCINATELGKRKYFWNGTIMVNFEDLNRPIQDYREAGMMLLAKFNPSFIRRVYYSWFLLRKVYSKGFQIRFVSDAGWHFSYLGGVEKIIHKLEAFAHEEYNKPEYKDPKRIEQAIANGEDIFGRGFRYRFVALDESWPSFIRMHQEKYSAFIAAVKA